MNKIRFIANMDTNYVFHMLSVSKCGYDNSYGQHYAPRYPAEDLAVLKTQEKLITVRGGEHCGALYGIFVCEAACAKLSAKDYYTKLIQKATNNDIPVTLLKTKPSQELTAWDKRETCWYIVCFAKIP